VTETKASTGFVLNPIGYNLIAKYKPASEKALTTLEPNYSIPELNIPSIAGLLLNFGAHNNRL
jgi:hypothetical protein